MITLQLYINKDSTIAKFFDKNEYLFNMEDGKKGFLTKKRIDVLLKKLELSRTDWKKTDWGWQCKLIQKVWHE